MAHRTMVMVKKTYLHIAIVMLLTAILWLAVTIYQSLVSPSDTIVDKEIRAAINPKIDNDTLNNLVNREDLAELKVEIATPSSAAATINEVAPSIQENVEATDSAKLEVVEVNNENQSNEEVILP